MSTFTLKIKLGNDGMRGSKDIAEMLCKEAEKIEFTDLGKHRYIYDANGNCVGSWVIEQ